MAVEIVMPKLSDTMEEGRILKWLKKEGDFVKKGEVVAEVETDKADMDLEVFSSGVISEILYQEGDTVPVGTVIAVLGGESKKEGPKKTKEESKEAKDEPKQKAKAETPAEEAEESTEAGEPCCTISNDDEGEEKEAEPEEKEKKPANKKAEKLKLSPAARRLVEDRDIDASALTGNGPDGRIVKEDVEQFLKARQEKKEEKKADVERETPVSGVDGEDVVELSKMRATIARRMTQSKQTIPHFYVTVEVDMGEADRLIAAINKMEDDDGKATYNDIIVKACALALRDHPEMNAHFTDKGLIQKRDINVGVVVALKAGLLVPVVQSADQRTIKEISQTVKGLRDRVLKRESKPEDLSGGTFTISNMGMFGVDEFSAIINPPQVAILAVAAVKDVPVMRGSTIQPAKIMKMTLSADHRAVDGLIVAKFLQRVRELLENPVALILKNS